MAIGLDTLLVANRVTNLKPDGAVRSSSIIPD